MLNEGGEIYSDESYPFTIKDNDGNEYVETIRVRLGILPDFGKEGNLDRKINLKNQGFYVLRNNREVEQSETLGFYTRHPVLNRFRGEIYFSANMDKPVGINFRKVGVDFEKSVFDKIHADVKHQISAIRNQLSKFNIAAQSGDVDHRESEHYITSKTPLLKTPPPQEYKEELPQEKGEKGNKTRGKDKEKRQSRQQKRVEFIAEHGGRNGHIYEARMQGKTVIIAWNIDHPFYERFVVSTKGNKTLSSSIDYLVYSLATAELGLLDEDNIDMIENFKTIMSMNLNTLLR